MTIISLDSADCTTRALATLQDGGLVVCPTETVYGVLADCENPAAIDRLLRYKRRPAGKAISIAVADKSMAEKYANLNTQAQKIYETFLPGPVTVVSPSRHVADKRLESEFATIGIRWPDYPFLTGLIKKFGRGVTATSANAHGQKTPYCLADILDHLSTRQKNLLDLIIDAGTLPKNPPSLVIDTTAPTPIVVRANAQLTKQFSPFLRLKLISHSDEETRVLAGKILNSYLADIATTGLIIGLDGDLGAGKTTFTQGLARFLGITDAVTSPTYTYLKEYAFTKFDQPGTLAHLDAWTLDQPELLAALDLPHYTRPGNLVVIEWWQQLASFFHPDLPVVTIKITADKHNPDNRKIFVYKNA